MNPGTIEMKPAKSVMAGEFCRPILCPPVTDRRRLCVINVTFQLVTE
jgi:hypothetical protein